MRQTSNMNNVEQMLSVSCSSLDRVTTPQIYLVAL